MSLIARMTQHFATGRRSTGVATRVMIDSLEARKLMASSASLLASDGLSGGGSTTPIVTQAVKASTTSIKVLTASSAVGEAVRINVAVTSRSTALPGGTVTIKSGTTTLGTTNLLSNGTAKFSLSNIPIGAASLTAVYSGSSRFAISTSVAVKHVVTGLATTAKLSVTSPATTLIGNPTTLLAKIAPVSGTATATGRVAFYDGSTLLGSKTLNSTGAARLTANYLFVGMHALKAVYLGSPTLLSHRTAVKTVTVDYPALTTASDGLQVGVVTAGAGTRAATGDIIVANYTGYLSTGTKFQSSLDSGTPFTFQLGVGGVITGFDEGLSGVRAGEKRVLIIPPDLGYGATPRDGIPANSTLIFVVDVISVTPPG